MPNEHTPGPWQVKHSDDEPYGDIQIIGNGRALAKIWLDDAPVPDYNRQQKANAKLIAAAPKLLEALKITYQELSEVYPEDSLNEGYFPDAKPVMDGIKSIINKAEGS